MEDQPCRRVQHRLESAQEVGWDQHAVAVVQPGVHQGDDQCLERGRRHTPTNLTQLALSGETARYRSLDVRSHRQVGLDINAQITDERRWGDSTLGVIPTPSAILLTKRLGCKLRGMAERQQPRAKNIAHANDAGGIAPAPWIRPWTLMCCSDDVILGISIGYWVLF